VTATAPVHSSLSGAEAPQGFGVQLAAPLKVPVQADIEVSVQQPPAEQHAPGCGQGLGVQVVAPSVKTLPTAVQPPAERMVQAPAVVQHEPTLGQGLGSQTVVRPWNVLVVVEQPVALVIVQAPVVLLQQAPTNAAQGLIGRQVVPAPTKVLVPVQAVASVIEQVPVLEQHAPARVGPHATAVVQEAPSITVSVNGAGTVVAVNVLTRM